MAFEILLHGIPPGAVRQRIVDLVGQDRVVVDGDRLVLTLPDQPAAIGALAAINDLGCDVDELRRAP
ncbi:MAG TPA: hypothetical protein VK917_06555 [Ilumatobacter sp.]|nr:hypothetical protein [Ilumatobacter sp.]